MLGFEALVNECHLCEKKCLFLKLDSLRFYDFIVKVRVSGCVNVFGMYMFGVNERQSEGCKPGNSSTVWKRTSYYQVVGLFFPDKKRSSGCKTTAGSVGVI